MLLKLQAKKLSAKFLLNAKHINPPNITNAQITNRNNTTQTCVLEEAKSLSILKQYITHSHKNVCFKHILQRRCAVLSLM